MKRFLLIFLIFSFLIPAHCQGVENRVGIEPPGTFEEVVTTLKEIGREIIYGIPKSIALLWNRAVDPVINFVDNKILPKIEYQVNRGLTKIENWFLSVVKPKVEKEVEERKPVIKEELEKEADEIKQDTDKVKESAWQNLKDWAKGLF